MPAAPKILFATSEAHPLIKTGGLADVSGALPAALHALGLDIKLLIPGYRAVLRKCRDTTPVARIPNPFAPGEVVILECRMPETGIPVLIVCYDKFFNRDGGPYQQENGQDWPDNPLRFGLLSFVAAWLGSDYNRQTWRPDLIHCNDWQTGLTPAYLRFWPGRKPPVIMTLHNLAYQGVYGKEWLAPLGLPPASFSMQGLEYYGNLSFLKSGCFYADRLTTVSPTYAREIQHEALGFGMHGLLHERRAVLTGILNGIDVAEWNPQADTHLPHAYSADDLTGKTVCKTALQAELRLAEEAHTPLVAIISRITYQKGSDVILGAIHELAREGVQFAVLGTGDRAIEHAYLDLAHAHQGRVAVMIGYDEGLSHRIEAGADLFLMPSRYEPCGLNQMYSQRYGTPPIVHATGGLADTVVDVNDETLAERSANGFVLDGDTPHALWLTLERASRAWHDKRLWQRIQQNGMRRDFSWQNAAAEYGALYRDALAIHA